MEFGVTGYSCRCSFVWNKIRAFHAQDCIITVVGRVRFRRRSRYCRRVCIVSVCIGGVGGYCKCLRTARIGDSAQLACDTLSGDGGTVIVTSACRYGGKTVWKGVGYFNIVCIRETAIVDSDRESYLFLQSGGIWCDTFIDGEGSTSYRNRSHLGVGSCRIRFGRIVADVYLVASLLVQRCGAVGCRRIYRDIGSALAACQIFFVGTLESCRIVRGAAPVGAAIAEVRKGKSIGCFNYTVVKNDFFRNGIALVSQRDRIGYGVAYGHFVRTWNFVDD